MKISSDFIQNKLFLHILTEKKAPLISSIINIQHKYYQSDINNISLKQFISPDYISLKIHTNESPLDKMYIEVNGP